MGTFAYGTAAILHAFGLGWAIGTGYWPLIIYCGVFLPTTAIGLLLSIMEDRGYFTRPTTSP